MEFAQIVGIGAMLVVGIPFGIMGTIMIRDERPNKSEYWGGMIVLGIGAFMVIVLYVHYFVALPELGY